MTASDIALVLLRGAGVTLQISVGAWILSASLGLFLGIAIDLGSKQVKACFTGLILVLRALPQLVVLYLFYFGLGALGLNIPSIAAAILALGVTDSAFMAEYYRAALLTVSPNQHEAGKSLGLSRLGVFRRVVLPQALPVAMPALLNSFISLLKLATLAAAVGSPEILYRSQSVMQTTGQMGLVIGIVISLYIGVTVPLSRVVRALEHRISSRWRSA